MAARPIRPWSVATGLAFANGFRASMLAVLYLMSFVHSRDGLPMVLGGLAFQLWAALYVGLIVVWQLLRHQNWPDGRLLTFATTADCVMTVWLMGMNHGVSSGYGILLLPYLALAGLMASGRFALFYAAVATAALFGYLAWEAVFGKDWFAAVFPVGLLSLAGFVTSAAMFQLGRVARDSRDMALRHRGELANLHQLNELILQSQRDAILVVDEDAIVHQFNAQAATYFPAMQRGLVLPEMQPLVTDWQRNGYAPSAMRVNPVVKDRRLTGRMVPILAGDERAAVLFLRDQADVAEEARRQKLAALGRLTANMAHEIRNPLAAISHATDLLAEQVEDAQSIRLTQIVRTNVQRINTLVEEVRLLGRRDKLHTEHIQLPVFLHEFVEHFVLAQPDAHAAIVLHIRSQRPLLFDRGHLMQILTNLVENGWRHASQQPGCIRISLYDAPEYGVELTVSNDGAGLDEATQSHLFEPFFTTESSGTGLGLFIARELAEANNARLDYIPPAAVFRLIGRSVDD